MLPLRIENKINKTATCWLWTGAIDRKGYGVVSWQRKACRAHRIVRELLVAPTPLELDHLCRVTNCVRPEHLEPVSHSVNVRRGMLGKAVSQKWAKPRDCPQGHPLEGDNLYIYYNDRLNILNRQCRICKREGNRRRRTASLKN